METWVARSAQFARKNAKIFTFIAFCLLLLAAPLDASGQQATVVGTVTDPVGAMIPNATITAIAVSTGLGRTATTTDAGQYVLPDLPIGLYNVKAEASGFSVEAKNGLVLNVGDRLRVDFAMKVGQTQETVTVAIPDVKLQTESGEVSDVITGQQITQLESNGRSLYSLANLTPGAASLQADFQVPTPMGGDANISFNGMRVSHNLWLLDGGEIDDRGGGGSAVVMPSEDALAEFRQLTSNYSAEYGLSSAATISSVIKSGTRHFHASGWWFGRNDAFDARNYFNPQYNANGTQNQVAKLRFNTWGFNGGGPIIFKHTDNPKTFFFYNMEWRSLIQGNNFNVGVPFTSAYGGDLSQALTSGLVTTGIHAPYVCQVSATVQAQFAGAGQALSGCTNGAPDSTKAVGFNNNTIPAPLLDGNAQTLLKAGIFPAPNSGARFVGPANAPTNVREELVRIDHTFSDRFSIFGHWISEQVSQTDLPTRWSSSNVPTVGDTFGNPSYSAVIGATYAISQRMLNETRFTYGGNRINMVPIGLSTLPSGFNSNRIFNGQTNIIPIIALSKQTGSNFSNNWNPWINKADSYGISDSVAWTKGSQQIKIGGSWQYFLKAQPLQVSTQGSFGFNGSFTGYDFADFLLGYSQSYTEAALKDTRHWDSKSYALFVQDDWRATQRLTLNLGLRWDGIPHTYEANGQMSNFYPNLYNQGAAPTFLAGNSQISPNSAGLGTSPNPILAGYQFYLNGIGIPGITPGVSKGLVANHWAAFGPRIGFAYDLTGNGQTVVRGGFGIMYERIQGNDMYQAGANVPFSSSASLNNVSLSNPKQNVQNGSLITAPPLPIVVPTVTQLNSARYQLPASYQYSFGVQRALASRSVLSLAYVGNVEHYQSDAVNTDLPPINQLPALAVSSGAYNTLLPYLGYHAILTDQDEGNSSYNSLQIELHSHLRNGLQLQGAYTFSRAIDPSTGSGGDGFDLDTVSNPYAGWSYDRGPSVFDRTHVAFVNFIYDLPLFRNSASGFLKSSLGGWQTSGIVTMESGAPLNLGVSGSTVCSFVPDCAVRPNLTGKISYPKSKATLSSGNNTMQWFDPTAFSIAPVSTGSSVSTFGDLGHNALRGPGRDNWNLALFKTFPLVEQSHIELRAEAYNVWNHTQFSANTVGGGASGGIGSSLAGTDFGKVNSAYDPRVFQFGAKIIW
jgi:hypothetical protein